LRVSENPIYLLNNFITPVLRHFTRSLLPSLEVVKSFGPRIPNMEMVVEDIGTVFTQLTTNACEALCARIIVEPEFQPILRFSCQLSEADIRIHIDDNGDGIPEFNLPKIFTPFFTTRESASNLGLGLSTSYDIVLNGYDGEILLVPNYEDFTRFTIVLPLSSKAVSAT